MILLEKSTSRSTRALTNPLAQPDLVYKSFVFVQNTHLLFSSLPIDSKAMRKHKVFKFIFSSSATVYGDPETLPLVESIKTGLSCTNPYGKSKHMVEQILEDLSKSSSDWSIISLRYFNPVGAHSSGEIGEDSQDIPNNLMPYVTQVAVGQRDELKVFGIDYNTPDGTGVRDYIHIEDLAVGHLKALDKISEDSWKGFHAINLGTGRGYSVLEVSSTKLYLQI